MSNQWTHINATSEISEAQEVVLLTSAIFGVIAVIPNAILFTVLVCVKSYRVDNVLLILSCVSDTITCVGISVDGFTRYSVIVTALRTDKVPNAVKLDTFHVKLDITHVKLDTLLNKHNACEIKLNNFQIKASFFDVKLESFQKVMFMKEEKIETIEETRWSCALYAFVYIRTFGNVMAPLMQVANSVERLICIRFPIVYRQCSFKRKLLLGCFAPLAALVTLGCGFILAYVRRDQKVSFICGRRHAYGLPFANFLYLIQIFGYFTAFAIGTSTYILVLTHRQCASSTSKRHLQMLKIVLAMSFISFTLISIPNVGSFINTFIPLEEVLVHIALSASLVAFSLNLFVYIAISKEFRQNLLCVLRCHWFNRKRVLNLHSMKMSTLNQCT